MTERKNLLLLTIDCLRADHLGCYGYRKRTSQFIDGLASNGILFLQAISHGGGTPEAFPSILASVHPPLHQYQYRTLFRESTSLPEVLRERGYETASFHSNPYLSSVFSYNKGFDVFEDGMGDTRTQKFRRFRSSLVKLGRWSPAPILRFLSHTGITDSPILRAPELCKRAASFVAKTSQDFFLWVHFMDVHSPRIPPPQYIKQFCSHPVNLFNLQNIHRKAENSPHSLSTVERENLIDLYDASVKYVDDSIFRFCKTLGKRLQNTIIVVTSDHGEALGEHKVFGHRNILYDYIIRVPLIITGPGIEKGVVMRKQFGLMDIAPTILELLNLRKEKNFYGESLLSPNNRKGCEAGGILSVTIDPRSGIRAFSYRTESHKYIQTEMIKGGQAIHRSLYDLKKDPCEKRNQIKVMKKKALEFECKLSRIRKYISQRRAFNSKISEKGRLKKRIKALRHARKL